jgi:transcription initiation factor TFIIIB Brf1 subunit/transcription initiation factor TFIIB
MKYDEDLLNTIFNEMNINMNNDETKEENKIIYNCFCTSGDPEIIDVRGDTICKNCGKVLENENISFENESLIYGGGEDGITNTGSSRCSGFTDELLSQSSHGTIIGGNSRMSKLNFWLTYTYQDSVIFNVKNIFTDAAETLKVPPMVVRHAALIYKEMFNKKVDDRKLIVRGKNKIALLSVCFYYSLQQLNITIPVQYVLDHFKIDKKAFNKSFNLLQDNLKNYKSDDINVKEYINVLCNKLNVPYKNQKLCLKLYTACKALQIININPINSCIASIIYFMKKETNEEEVDIAKKAFISKETIIKNYKKLIDNKLEIFNYVKNEIN